jgi:hypothetical protein
MPQNTSQESIPSGPGFLSRVYFDFTHTSGGSPACSESSVYPYISNWQLDCLVVRDLFLNVNNPSIPVGRNDADSPVKKSSFEQTIYVY